MLLEFFLERARIENAGDGLHYSGYVPDLPEIHVRAASFGECRSMLARAISELLTLEANSGRTMDSRATHIDETPLPETSAHDQPANPPASDRAALLAADDGRTRPEIVYEKRDWIARVTINRPEAYNAYTTATLSEMAEAFRDAAEDKHI